MLLKGGTCSSSTRLCLVLSIVKLQLNSSNLHLFDSFTFVASFDFLFKLAFVCSTLLAGRMLLVGGE